MPQRKIILPLFGRAIPGDEHRDHRRWDWDRYTVDRLGNARARDKDVDLLFEGESLRLTLRLARRFGRHYYIFTRISKGRCAKRQRD